MTKHKEPSDAAVLAARIMLSACGCASRWREGLGPPPMSAYTAASLAERLCAIEWAQNVHVLRQVNGDYSRDAALAARSELRAETAIKRDLEAWRTDLGMPCEVVLGFEPGGPMISLKLPGEAEAVTV